MHEAMYETNPAIKAVLHAHAPNAMFWATTGLPMPNLTEATAKVKRFLSWTLSLIALKNLLN